MIKTKDLGQGQFAQVPPGEDGGFEGGKNLGKECGPHQHAGDAPEGVPTAFSHGSHRSAGAISQESPAHAKDEASQDVGAELGGFEGKFSQPEVLEKINADHAHQDTGKHKFDDGHIHKAKGPQLLIVTQDPAFLEEKAEEDAGNQAVEKSVHDHFPEP